MHTIKLNLLSLIFLFCFLYGCGLSSKAMVPDIGGGMKAPIDKSISVVEVKSAREATFGGPEYVSNEMFKEALTASLKKAQLFREVRPSGPSDLTLSARVVLQDQHGFIPYVARSIIEYVIRDAGSRKTVWEERYESSHQSSSLSGATRTKVAREGSIKMNLSNFIRDINIWKASELGRAEIVKLMLDSGVDIDLQDKEGVTPLMKASANGHMEIVQLFISNGADLHIKDNNGNTALNFAALKEHNDVVQLLTKNGAIPPDH